MPADRLLPCLALACIGAVGLPAQAAAAEPGPEFGAPEPPVSTSLGDGLRKRGGFLTLSPGLIGVPLGLPAPFYVWGIDGGYHLPIGRVFALQAGAFLEHIPTPPAHSVRTGAIGRFGGGNEKVFGYALVRLGADVIIVHRSAPTSRSVGGAFHASLGGGVMGMLHRIVGLGSEAAFDVLAANGGFAVLIRLRLFVALKF